MKRYGMMDRFQTVRTARSVSFLSALVLLLTLVSKEQTAIAQEAAWPLPGKAPDILVGAEYGLNAFDKVYAPMHQGTVYGGLRSSSGAYLLKLVGGKRFGQTGFQGELETYPVLAKELYAYASYAYGETPVYPRHRIGVEVYSGLPSGFEASLGGRYFRFVDDESVLLATGSLSYYMGNFILTLKPFVSLNTPKTSVAGVFTARYYLSENEEYMTGRIGAGFAPDERWIQTAQGIPGRETTLLQSQTIGAAIQKIVMTKLMFLGRLDVTRQEVVFHPGSYVMDFAIGCGFRVLL